jgi:D-alanyl-D-alanine carboxypeptidase
VLSPVLGQGPPAGSAATPSTEIKNLLDKQTQDQHLVGIASLVIRSNTIVGMATSGVKHQGGSTPLGPADLWHLGSSTKAITATMIARLVDAGKLSWTTTPVEIFPDWKEMMHPAFRNITIEQLLSHHAGIPPFTKVKASPNKTWPKPWPHLSGTAVQQRSQFAALVLKHAPAITPGTKGIYSNAGFVIAAAMAERRTGLSWEDLVTSQVLEPLGMHAIFGFPLWADRNQPWGHVETKRGFKAVSGGAIQLPPYMLPAGGMAMALADYGRFLQMNLKGLRGEDTEFLSAKTIQRLHSSTMHDQYALGWETSQIDGVPSSVHNGSAGSFYAVVALQPSRDEGVAVVLNSGGERSWEAADALLNALLRRYAAAPR